MALVLSLLVAAGSAQADHGSRNFGFQSFGFHSFGFHNSGFRTFGFHRFVGFHHPFFFRHEFFFHRGLFRPFFFFGAPAFAPVPAALDPPYSYPGYFYDQAENGGNCYQYETMILINGAPTPAWGTACMQSDGTWRTVP
jgi:hypothetical protein